MRAVLAPQDNLLTWLISWGERVHANSAVRYDLIGRSYRLEVEANLRTRIERMLAK